MILNLFVIFLLAPFFVPIILLLAFYFVVIILVVPMEIAIKLNIGKYGKGGGFLPNYDRNCYRFARLVWAAGAIYLLNSWF